MNYTEQLKLVTPEYTEALNELGTLVESLPNKFPDDIEYFRSGFRLPLRTKDMKSNTYYTVTKSLPYPYPENPDWYAIPSELGKVTERGDDSGFEINYKIKKGSLTIKSDPYDNNEFSDIKELPAKELSLAEIQKIIEELSIAHPVHPDKDKLDQNKRTRNASSLIRRLLF